MEPVKNVIEKVKRRIENGLSVPIPDKEKCKDCKGGIVMQEFSFIQCKLRKNVFEAKDCMRFNQIQIQQERERKEARRDEVAKKLGLPKRYWKASLDYKSKIAKRTKKFLLEQGRCLILSGGVGCGKTSACCAYLIEKEYGMFVDISEIRNAVYSYDKKFINEIKKTEILVIDDLGAKTEGDSEFFVSVIDEIVNARHGDELTTLITTNATLAELSKRYGERTADRLREWGIFFSSKERSFRKR